MVMPLTDDNSGRQIFPAVNYVLIGLNVLVYVFLQGMGSDDAFTYAWATVPAEIVSGRDIREPVTARDRDTGRELGSIELRETPASVYLTLLTAMFMHGSIAHLLGNMLFLWIFGDNIEDALGHVRYLLFYLVCGVLASLAHVVVTYATGANPYIPSLGASGAISAVLGAYIVLHPYRQVLVILLRFLMWVPAWVAIGIWFLFQVINSLGLLGAEGGGGGVAYGAHLGGFLAGVALIKPFAIGRDTRDGRLLWERRRMPRPPRR